MITALMFAATLTGTPEFTKVLPSGDIVTLVAVWDPSKPEGWAPGGGRAEVSRIRLTTRQRTILSEGYGKSGPWRLGLLRVTPYQGVVQLPIKGELGSAVQIDSVGPEYYIFSIPVWQMLGTTKLKIPQRKSTVASFEWDGGKYVQRSGQSAGTVRIDTTSGGYRYADVDFGTKLTDEAALYSRQGTKFSWDARPFRNAGHFDDVPPPPPSILEVVTFRYETIVFEGIQLKLKRGKR